MFLTHDDLSCSRPVLQKPPSSLSVSSPSSTSGASKLWPAGIFLWGSEQAWWSLTVLPAATICHTRPSQSFMSSSLEIWGNRQQKQLPSARPSKDQAQWMVDAVWNSMALPAALRPGRIFWRNAGCHLEAAILEEPHLLILSWDQDSAILNWLLLETCQSLRIFWETLWTQS